MPAWQWAGLLLLLPPACWLLLLLVFRRAALAAWREPVLAGPVLVIESDDWGPGPPQHAEALRRLAACLLKYRDASGRPPVMTLGLVLSLPDSAAIAAAATPGTPLPYRALPLDSPAYADILAAIRAGIAAGVFVPQLHGMAHYWPAALMRAGETDADVRAWILAGPGQASETLPSPLQSRWVDAGVLPSRPLPEAEIRAAVGEEIACYRRIFGSAPEVVVPPTFVWTEAVEAAWAAHGVRVLITPGRRCSGRDAQGRPACARTPIHNGECGLGGIRYLVRDRYFEPARGHTARQALAALAEKTAQGRPCLLETHRNNFTAAQAEAALAELDDLLRQALGRFPDLRFLAPAELDARYRQGEGLHAGLRARLAAWQARMRAVPRFARLARLSGLDRALGALAPASRRTAG